MVTGVMRVRKTKSLALMDVTFQWESLATNT